MLPHRATAGAHRLHCEQRPGRPIPAACFPVQSDPHQFLCLFFNLGFLTRWVELQNPHPHMAQACRTLVFTRGFPLPPRTPSGLLASLCFWMEFATLPLTERTVAQQPFLQRPYLWSPSAVYHPPFRANAPLPTIPTSLLAWSLGPNPTGPWEGNCMITTLVFKVFFVSGT